MHKHTTKVVKKFFALEVDTLSDKEYKSVAGPFKNKTACEWWIEHNAGDALFKVQEVTKS